MRAGKVWRTVMSVAVLVGSVALVAAPATAQTPEPEVLYVAPVVIVNPLQPDTARVVGIYRCFGGEPIHFWASVKQGGPDPTAEGSGATSTSWYDTNIIAPPPVTCDGRYHAAVVTVGKYPDKAQLSPGEAWIQFCLVAPGDSGNPFGIVASQSKFGRVVGAGA